MMYQKWITKEEAMKELPDIKKWHIMDLNPQILADPILIETAKRLFDFANDMGLQGKKLRNLEFIFPKEEKPLETLIHVTCEEILG